MEHCTTLYCLKTCFEGSLPVVVQGGLLRFTRTLVRGVIVGVDYKYSLWGLDDQSDDYQVIITKLLSGVYIMKYIKKK